GTKLDSYDELPDWFKDEIDRHYPEYRTPPPLDDDRENVTSWIYYRDVARGDRAAPDRN
ncbi:MAG: DUF1838 family protein, partial [Oceanicaulis sp.]